MPALLACRVCRLVRPARRGRQLKECSLASCRPLLIQHGTNNKANICPRTDIRFDLAPCLVLRCASYVHAVFIDDDSDAAFDVGTALA